jgi:hypothetical protein
VAVQYLPSVKAIKRGLMVSELIMHHYQLFLRYSSNQHAQVIFEAATRNVLLCGIAPVCDFEDLAGFACKCAYFAGLMLEALVP